MEKEEEGEEGRRGGRREEKGKEKDVEGKRDGERRGWRTIKEEEKETDGFLLVLVVAICEPSSALFIHCLFIFSRAEEHYLGR